MAYFCSILLYNVILHCLCLILAPLLILVSLTKKKYRKRILHRFGFGLRNFLPEHTNKKTIWIHSLSVGETTSALPLIKGIRLFQPDVTIILSVTTSSGHTLADKYLAEYVDHIIPAPLDLLPSISLFIKTIRPDMFILVETDFWPNWLFLLKKKNIPAILVNGRISVSSFTRYKRFAFFFRPLFNSFQALVMQTAGDSQSLQDLGLSAEKIHTLGNLKFDTQDICQTISTDPGRLKRKLGLHTNALVWICGSTHEGEEKIVINVFKKLIKKIPALQLIIAPRDINRCDEIASLLADSVLIVEKRSILPVKKDFHILLLDTLGELARTYQVADLAFIGGSLVNQGGHNPIEPAAFKVPVLFGPHMEDFMEISTDLLQSGGAFQLHSEEQLYSITLELLLKQERRKKAGTLAHQWINSKKGVVEKHIELIKLFLS